MNPGAAGGAAGVVGASRTPGLAGPLRGGILVLAALLAWNAGNYAFFLIAGRVLGPADYGLVAALLSATLVVAVPAQALQFAAARVTAAGMVRRPEAARAVFRRAWDQCAAVTPVALIAVLAAVGLAWLVRPGIPTGPLVTTVALVAPLGFYFLALGRLQGQGRFGGFALCFALWGAPRPVVLLPLAAAGLGVYAALGATGVALASALAAAMWLTRERTRAGRPCPDDWRAFVRELGPVVAGLGGLGLLTNLDVIVAKLALGAEAAGQFAAAAVLAKAVFLIPQAVSFVLLPRVASRSAASATTGALVGAGVAIALITGAAGSGLLWLASDPLVRLTFGQDFSEAAALLGPFAFASSLIGALIVVINHHIGRGGRTFVWSAVALACLQIALFAFFNSSPYVIVAVDAVVGAAGLALHELLFWKTGEAIVPGVLRALSVARRRSPA